MYFGTTFMQLKCPADYKAPTVKKEPRGVPLPTITDRQSAIINGSAAKVRKNEVTVLLDKLTRHILLIEFEPVAILAYSNENGLSYSFFVAFRHSGQLCAITILDSLSNGISRKWVILYTNIMIVANLCLQIHLKNQINFSH